MKLKHNIEDSTATLFQTLSNLGVSFEDEEEAFEVINNHVLKIANHTGLKDSNREDIYGGDKLYEFVDTDEGLVKSVRTVYYCSRRARWMLDSSPVQDQSFGYPLSKELRDFKLTLDR